ncbi:MAG: ATP-binding cassette domain-containing protein [Betaproteobacteria bacterium]|nr:ATP-binding cassette domain-containing protein [Betaproteobacteria bacterium]
MIHFRNLTLARGARKLISDASLQIHAGWRVGLVGANGSGKSSLFALLRGELHADLGDCELPPAWRIASVAQETPALEVPAIDYVLDGDTELRAIERELGEAQARHDGGRVGELHARLADIDGYGARARAASLLAGLGFSTDEIERPVASFSGGWRMRLNLAQALVSRCDLMLLDEPTNHLDLDAVVWLEQWLAAFRGTLIVVSHDRDFLDGCVTHLLHIYAGQLTLYTGNYSAFETQRAAQLAVQQAMYDKQQRQIAHLEKYINRFRAQATKARQAQSRLKALARMERISAAHVDSPFEFEFMQPERAPDPMLTLDEVDAGYGGMPVIGNVKLTLRPGARIGLLGPNGAGKSTLIKLLAGEHAPLNGKRLEGRGLAIGYFAQHQLEQLREDESPMWHLVKREPRTREQDLRNYLGGFDFRGNMADTQVAPFSGGEKSRLALALMIRTRPNLLLLDEPTNHLDLEMRHALNVALAEYEGSLVLVSHDRALLRSVCDSFLLVADGKVTEFDGDVDDYLAWLSARRAAKAAPAEKPARSETRAAPKTSKPVGGRKPLEREAEKLERELTKLNHEKQTLDTRLADPALYQQASTSDLRAMAERQTVLAQLIEAAEHRWLQVHAELDALGVQ